MASPRPARCREIETETARTVDEISSTRSFPSKALYRKQEHGDNYVDWSSFLSSLVLNADMKECGFLDLSRGAASLVQQLSLICLFVSVGRWLQRNASNHRLLLVVDAVLVACELWSRVGAGRRRSVWRSFLLCFAAMVLRLAAMRWDTKTVLLTTLFLLGAHAALQDYSSEAHEPGRAEDERPVSLKIAVLAAWLLASRLSESWDVIAFMIFSAEIFALFPVFSSRLRRRFPAGHSITLTCSLFFLVSLIIETLWETVLFFFLLSAVGLVGPALFLWARRYKIAITGSWDMARVPTEISEGARGPARSQSENRGGDAGVREGDGGVRGGDGGARGGDGGVRGGDGGVRGPGSPE